MASSSKSSKKSKATAPAGGVTPVSAWKGGNKALDKRELTLPSGNVCLINAFSISQLISEGLLVDSLLPLVADHVDKGQGKKPSDFQGKGGKPRKGKKGNIDAGELLKDPKKMTEMFDGIDKAIPRMVAEPTVLYHKVEKEENGITSWVTIPAEERQDDVLYTDVLDFADKMTVFEACLEGTEALESFLPESE